MLPPPYTEPNCIYHEEEEWEYDSEVRPSLVYVVTSKFVKPGDELLADYHWMLNGMYSSLIGDVMQCTCH